MVAVGIDEKVHPVVVARLDGLFGLHKEVNIVIVKRCLCRDYRVVDGRLIVPLLKDFTDKLARFGQTVSVSLIILRVVQKFRSDAVPLRHIGSNIYRLHSRSNRGFSHTLILSYKIAEKVIAIVLKRSCRGLKITAVFIVIAVNKSVGKSGIFFVSDCGPFIPSVNQHKFGSRLKH